ncbi:MAG: iron-containing alcohol dehydrogenase family protein [Coprococcus sp.]
MNMNVYMPTRLVTGRGCVAAAGNELVKLGKKCLILTGRHSAKACGALDDMTAVLDNQGIAWKLCDIIGQNPRLTDCMEAAKLAAESGADFIIGIGGGSPLDAAKCTAVLAANPGMTQDELYSLKWPVKPLPVAAVGTTAGTGSEVTKVAVITIPDGRKKSLHHEDIYPVIAFGDPAYTLTLPEAFTRSTAIDALAHCVESYFSRYANELSRMYAVQGIRLLLTQFRKILQDGCRNLTYEDREVLYHASIYGGLAINITGTAMPHAVGYLLTEQHDIPHGAACAVFLPAFYFHNKKVVPELTAAFLQEIGCEEADYLQIIKAVLPEYHIDVPEEEIVREHHRWIDNTSIGKGWGTIDADQVDEILRRLSH